MADANEMVGPDAKSGDYNVMLPYWQMIDAIMGGAETMRKARERYLPKFQNESMADYDDRLKAAPFTNIYSDISQNLASKPFGRELSLKGGADDAVSSLCEDIDGQGNNLHVFASGFFQRGIDKAVDWIYVDHTKAVPNESGRPLTIQEERAAGSRPYWVHVAAENLLAVYSDRIGGTEVFVHARIYEPATVRDGYGEKTVDRVRVLNREPALDYLQQVTAYGPPTFEVFEKQKDASGKESWVSVEGPSPLTIGVIALVPFVTGKRIGSSWQIRPPLRDIAHLQVEEFQQESNLKSVMQLTCYPMLAGNGVAKPVDAAGGDVRVPVGPRGVLFAPPNADGTHGEWQFIEPSAASITALMGHLDSTQKNMRDLGMQPLTQANLTVITTANVSMKAHSAIQAWALKLKDALEQALKYTVMWMGMDASKAPEVDVFQDFGVDFEAGTELDSLLKAQGQGVLSKRTTQDEFKRRGVLSDNFDPDEEEKRIAEEEQGLEPEIAIDPVTGERIDPPNRPLVIQKPADLPPSPAI